MYDFISEMECNLEFLMTSGSFLQFINAESVEVWNSEYLQVTPLKPIFIFHEFVSNFVLYSCNLICLLHCCHDLFGYSITDLLLLSLIIFKQTLFMHFWPFSYASFIVFDLQVELHQKVSYIALAHCLLMFLVENTSHLAM